MPESISEVHLDFAARWEVEGECHFRYRVPCCQLLLVERGRLWARHGGRMVSAGPGDLLCIAREPLNEYRWDAPTGFWEAHLTLPGGLRIEGQPPPAVVPLRAYLGNARAAWETWCQELDRPGDVAHLRVQEATYGLLAAIAAAVGRAPARRVSDPWQRVRHHLERDLGRPLALSEVARVAGVTPDHLIRGFRRRHGLSPMAWRSREVLRRACTLLESGQPIKTIAHRLGFTNPSAFTRAFGRQYGQTPTDYLAHNRLPIPTAPLGDEQLSYPLNRHVRPPGSTTTWFTWR